MDRTELQYMIVARRYQLPSTCFIAFAMGTNKNTLVFYRVPLGQKHNSIGVVASAIGKTKTKTFVL